MKGFDQEDLDLFNEVCFEGRRYSLCKGTSKCTCMLRNVTLDNPRPAYLRSSCTSTSTLPCTLPCTLQVVQGYLEDDRVARSGEAALQSLRLSGLPWAQGEGMQKVWMGRVICTALLGSGEWMERSSGH